MSNIIVINATQGETRVATLENGAIGDFHLERRRSRGFVGNVYKARISRLRPEIQAAFVKIGLEKDAFIQGNDLLVNTSLDDVDDDDDGRVSARRRRRETRPIEELLQQGQEILVQVTKDPIDAKGARVTEHITLPGRHLVYMPTVAHIGISRQIQSDRERRRLRDIANDIKPKEGGFIVRTASAGVSAEHLRQDLEVLVQLWQGIRERANTTKGPALLHEDFDLILRATRDLATADLHRLIVDSREQYDRILEFVERVMPKLAAHVELYVGEEPIFDAFGIEDELSAALSRKVPLPSGGYLVIEKTEALHSIDVNTGRSSSDSQSLEETILRTNIEAAREIAYQLRLRNIGGLIIIDFIDMEAAANRELVNAELESALEGDRGRVKFTRISEFGIVEMTRKRTREALEQAMCDPCPHCEGTGQVRSAETMVAEILRDLHRQLPYLREFDIHVHAAPAVVELMEARERSTLKDLDLRFNKKLKLIADTRISAQAFRIIPMAGPHARAAQG